MNYDDAKRNMITQQIRAWDVLSDDTLNLLSEMDREPFIDSRYKKFAYADTSLPLAHGQRMLSPKTVGRILEALSVLPTETVLEVGTGSGYLTALLAELANHVYTIDWFKDFSDHAAKQAKRLSLNNITFETGDAPTIWAKHAPYDVIVITGSLPVLPQDLKNILKVEGRLFAFLGEAPCMEAVLLTKLSDTKWQQNSLFETEVPRLLETEAVEAFTF